MVGAALGYSFLLMDDIMVDVCNDVLHNFIFQLVMEVDGHYRLSEGSNNLFPTRVNQIRISPVKTRDSQTTRKSLKPFSSSIIQ